MKKRMNRVLTLALALVMCLSLVACGGSKDSGTPAPSQDAAQDTADGKHSKSAFAAATLPLPSRPLCMSP